MASVLYQFRRKKDDCNAKDAALGQPGDLPGIQTVLVRAFSGIGLISPQRPIVPEGTRSLDTQRELRHNQARNNSD